MYLIYRRLAKELTLELTVRFRQPKPRFQEPLDEGISKFKKLRKLLQRKRHFKIGFQSR